MGRRHARQHHSNPSKDNGSGVYIEDMYMIAGEPVCHAVIHMPGGGSCGIDVCHHGCIGDDRRVAVAVPTTVQPAGCAWIYSCMCNYTNHLYTQREWTRLIFVEMGKLVDGGTTCTARWYGGWTLCSPRMGADPDDAIMGTGR